MLKAFLFAFVTAMGNKIFDCAGLKQMQKSGNSVERKMIFLRINENNVKAKY